MYDPDTIQQALVEALDDLEWWHTERNGWRVTRMQGRHCVYDVVFHPAEPHLLLAYALVPLRVPEALRSAMAEAITRANYAMLLGNFELDFSDGELRFKVVVDLPDVALTTRLVADVLAASLASCDRYHPAFMAVMYGGVSAEEAIGAVDEALLEAAADDESHASAGDDAEAIGPHAWPSLASDDEHGRAPIPITPRTSDAEIERAVAELIESMERTVTEEDDEPEDVADVRSSRGESEPDLRLIISRRDRAHVRGCLLGGAVGDALGAPVEFLELDAIRARYGAAGITELDEYDGRVGAITDDTQMTLFTAEGLLRAETRGRERGMCHPPSVVYLAYLRWLRTQGAHVPDPPGTPLDSGWLIGARALHVQRAPGNTCLAALRSGRMGTIGEPINNSKGCGTVMRVAPAGIFPMGDAFGLGADISAITHGHPAGYLAGGAMAEIVAQLLAGESLASSVDAALARLAMEPGHEETTGSLRAALALAGSDGEPSAERVQSLGQGWVAEEALAIAVYCALVAGDDFAAGVRLAVNHSGDSDSTGAITGNLLGALLGVDAIPARWLAPLELRTEIERLADDLLEGYRGGDDWWAQYPGF